MAIRLDAVSTGRNGESNVREVAFQHACTGDDRYLIVANAKSGGASLEATYGGVMMTLLEESFGQGAHMQLWGMVNPPSGSHEVRSFYPPGTGSIYQGVIAASFTGVDQAEPFSSTHIRWGANDNPTIGSDPVWGEYVVSFMGHLYRETTSTAVQTDRTEIAKFTGGGGTTGNSHELVGAFQVGDGTMTSSYTLSEERAWEMVRIALKPKVPPKVWNLLMIIPTKYDTPFGAGMVQLDSTSQQVAMGEAEALPRKLFNASLGMGVFNVTTMLWHTPVKSEYVYHQTQTATNGYYVNAGRVRDTMMAEGFDFGPYDTYLVATDWDAVTSAKIAGLTTGYGWYSPLDPGSGRSANLHEFGHVIERHLRSQGYTNFPVCGVGLTSAIHCGVPYGYSSNQNLTWMEKFFSGTNPDDTGVNQAGWDKYTPVELRALSGEPSASPNFVHDTFVDETGASLQDHDPEEGGVWIKTSGAADVTITAEGRIRSSGTTANSPCVYYNSALASSPDVEVSADFTVMSLNGCSVGINARQDPTGEQNYYHARFSTSSSGTSYVQLYRFHWVLGNAQLGPSVVWSPAVGSTYRLKLEVVGGRKLVFIDDVLRIEDSTDTTMMDAGVAGFRFLGITGGATGLHVDNFNAEVFSSHRHKWSRSQIVE